MITATIAFETAQRVNRNNWLNAAGEKLSALIMNEAKIGKRKFSVCFRDLIQGAEDLFEAGEMLCYVGKMLEEAGYEHVITPDGTLIINW